MPRTVHAARKTARTDALTHPMPYCWQHERAWYPGPTEAGWMALSRTTLEGAVACLTMYGCSDVLRIAETLCDVCKAEERKSA
jgi:hypothetical protein